jgi:hypothetical protein
MRFAFECYGDQEVFRFLREQLDLALSPRHSYSQGEVINDLLVRRNASLGMVDEDRSASHHARRDSMKVIRSGVDIEHRCEGDRHLIVIKPDLERCFFNAMNRVGIKPTCAESPGKLHRLLAAPRGRPHHAFAADLRTLLDASRRRSVATFLTEIADALRGILDRP